jgi:hypothetical protein
VECGGVRTADVRVRGGGAGIFPGELDQRCSGVGGGNVRTQRAGTAGVDCGAFASCACGVGRDIGRSDGGGGNCVFAEGAGSAGALPGGVGAAKHAGDSGSAGTARRIFRAGGDDAQVASELGVGRGAGRDAAGGAGLYQLQHVVFVFPVLSAGIPATMRVPG